MNEAALLALLVKHEGFRAFPYRDSLGHWTVGIGRLVSRDTALTYGQACALCAPVPWSMDRARQAAAEHARKDMTLLDGSIPWWRKLPEGAQLALADMAYNLGAAGLLGFKDMLAAAERRDVPAVVSEMRDSRWAMQVGARRVSDLVALWRGTPIQEIAA